MFRGWFTSMHCGVPKKFRRRRSAARFASATCLRFRKAARPSASAVKRGVGQATGTRKGSSRKIRMKESRGAHAHHPAGFRVVERADSTSSRLAAGHRPRP